MTLKQLEAFYWAVTCTNFAVAAERLHLSPSSLSKRLAELEASLGVQLFDRTGHKASLTEDGERFMPRAAALLMAAEETRKSVGNANRISGRCLFGIGELSALTWLPQLMNHLGQHYGAVELHPQVDIGHVLDEQLRSGELDCAVIAGRSQSPLITSMVVGQGNFVWAASPALIGNASRMTDEMLAQHPVVTLPIGAGTSRILDEWLMSRKSDIRRRLTCNSWGGIAGLMIGGIGIGFLPESWARALAQRGSLRILKADPLLAPLTYTFQTRRDDERPILAAMLSAVKVSLDFNEPPRLL